MKELDIACIGKRVKAAMHRDISLAALTEEALRDNLQVEWPYCFGALQPDGCRDYVIGDLSSGFVVEVVSRSPGQGQDRTDLLNRCYWKCVEGQGGDELISGGV